MKTYKIISESNGEKNEVYTSTRKRDIESFFNNLRKRFEKGTSVIYHNMGWFSTEFVGTFQVFTTDYYIVKE